MRAVVEQVLVRRRARAQEEESVAVDVWQQVPLRNDESELRSRVTVGKCVRGNAHV